MSCRVCSIPEVRTNGTLATSGYYISIIFKRSVRSPRGVIRCPSQNAQLSIAMAELGSGLDITVRWDQWLHGYDAGD